MSFLPSSDNDVCEDDEPLMFGSDVDDDDEEPQSTAALAVVAQEEIVKRTRSPSESTASVTSLDSSSSSEGGNNDDDGNNNDDDGLESVSEDSQSSFPLQVDNGRSGSPRSSSLKKNYDIQEIPIDTQRKSWKNLPVPCMKTVQQNEIKRIESMGSFFHLQTQQQPKMKKSTSKVNFKDITIREYDLTLGDNPSVSYGPAISLDWNYSERETMCIFEYEGGRGGRRRSLSQMSLSHYRRKGMLSHMGHTREEIKQARKEINQVKRRRDLTKQLLPFQKLEDVLESASRKVKRAVVGGGKKGGNNKAADEALSMTTSGETTSPGGTTALRRSISAPAMSR